MKQRLFSLIMALFCIVAGAQADVVNINEETFPDEKFRNWVIGLPQGADGKLTDEEIAGVTVMMVPEMGIENLKGIEFFTALQTLYCSVNQLNSLDVSKNTALQYLDCDNNQLKTLLLSSALVSLSCASNQLESLDVSNNLALQNLNCNFNQLNSLDVSKNTALTSLSLSCNQLESLDLSKNTALIYLECGKNQLESLDLSKNTALTTLHCPWNLLTSLDLSKNTALQTLCFHRNAICGENMTTLVNSLPTIPTGEEGHLEVCFEENNNETPDGNKITTAQVKLAKDKGWKVYKWKNNILEEYATEPSVVIDINEDNFPDENFRNWLNGQDYGTDGKLTDEEIVGVTYISIPNWGIEDLTGIEYFKALQTLNCSGNQLLTLNVSKNTALADLYCFDNKLKSLDVSSNTALTNLSCTNNQLESLDLSKNTALITLDCGMNQLKSLDLSKNTALITLECRMNQLESLDVSFNTALTNLVCFNNQLESLDVSSNTALRWLECYDNVIRGLGMTALVNSLPTIPEEQEGCITVYTEAGETPDRNKMTPAQVKVATGKGWKVSMRNAEYSWVEYAGEPEINGDINGDGHENIADVVMLSKAILAGSTDTKYDVNGDGQVNADDITALVESFLY